jgi:hypothetical protein
MWLIWFLKKWKYNVNVSGFTNIFEWRHEVVKQFRKEHCLNWIFILLYHISYLLSPLCRLSNFKWKYGGYLQSCLSSSMISQNCWWYHHSVDKICQDLQRKWKALNTHNYLPCCMEHLWKSKVGLPKFEFIGLFVEDICTPSVICWFIFLYKANVFCFFSALVLFSPFWQGLINFF